MSLSQLEDVGALYLGPLFLMADPMGPLLDQDEEEEALSPSLSLEGKAPTSPPLSLSSYASSLSPYHSMSSPLSSASPPPSPAPTQPPLFLGTKVGEDPLSVPWLAAGDLLDVGADDGDDDAFAGMDWMSEKIDLSEFDLASLIGSSDESPGSPEELLDSLGSHVDLDLDSFDTTIPAPHDSLDLDLAISIPSLPVSGVGGAIMMEVDLDQEVVLKSEPPSPKSPAFTLELGSEVDVLDADKTPLSLPAAIIPDPSPIVSSLPPSGHLVVQSNEDQSSSMSPPDQAIETSPPSSDCDSDSGIESVAGSPPRFPSPPTAGSSRTKPYSKPEPPSAKTSSRVKSVSGAPKVVEKKLKKMEQNKTAANRYRQKKRVEQDLLNVECDELEKKNNELAEKAESISREIQYLKDLMEEVRKRRSKSSSVG